MILVSASFVVLSWSVLAWDFLTTPKMVIKDPPNAQRLLVKAAAFIACVGWFAVVVFKA